METIENKTVATLKQLRGVCRESAAHFGAAVGLCARQIYRYENGKADINNISHEIAQNIADYIGCAWEDIADLDLSHIRLAEDYADAYTIRQVVCYIKRHQTAQILHVSPKQDRFDTVWHAIPLDVIARLSPRQIADLVHVMTHRRF